MSGINEHQHWTANEVALAVWLRKNQQKKYAHGKIAHVLGRSQASVIQKITNHHKFLRGEDVPAKSVHEAAKRLLVNINSGKAEEMENRWTAMVKNRLPSKAITIKHATESLKETKPQEEPQQQEPILSELKKSKYSYEDLLKYKKYAELMEWIYQNEHKRYSEQEKYRLELAEKIKQAMGLLNV